MALELLSDFRLLFVVFISALVSLLGSVNVAARPAAVLTGRVATATTISSIFFMISRFANMFYLPLMAGFVGEAVRTQNTDLLLEQIRWVILGCATGTLIAWIFLGNFVTLYSFLVEILSIHRVRGLFRPATWVGSLLALLKRTPMPCRLGRLEGISPYFLFFNIFATAVWTIGALSAVYCSAIYPQYKSTALLLSGLVNAFAAIAFSVWVDPQAALITDQCLDEKLPQEKRRPPEQVYAATLHLAAGSFLGSLLGLVLLPWGNSLIAWATELTGSQGATVGGNIWTLVALNALLTLLASTTYAARVSAVITRQVATALAVYNLFFLITRLSAQVYGPLMGSMADHLERQGNPAQIEIAFRQVLAGASLGALVALLALPSFIEIINQAIVQLQRRGSVFLVLLSCFLPKNWPKILASLRPPGLLGVRPKDLRGFPKVFLIGNVLVLSVHSVGLMAAIFAGASLDPAAARAAVLLSSVVNGVATITLSLVVDPTLAGITDDCVKDKRDPHHIRVAAVGLLLGMFLGTILSQLVFTPATWVVVKGALLVEMLVRQP